MKAKTMFAFFIICLTAVSLLVLPVGATEGKADEKSTDKTTDKVESKKQQETSKKRKQIIQEAVDAINQTKKAVKALEDNKPKEALAALEAATGKLELTLAREPDLALAPIDVDVTTYDLYAEIVRQLNLKAQDIDAVMQAFTDNKEKLETFVQTG